MIIKKENVIIQDICTWRKYAEPKGGEQHWKDGRSAKEFARYMTQKTNVLPKAIEDYLKSIGVKGCDFICQPEHVTDYDKDKLGIGTGRHHDGLLIAKPIAVIGIEAKVSEPFDKRVKYKLKAAVKLNKDKGENRKKRIMGSIKLITGSDKVDEVGHLMYQLISMTTGTLIEAQKAGVKKAVVLIIEFVGDVYKEDGYENKVKVNADAYEDYLKFLKINDKNDIDRKIRTEDDIEIWFKKLTISISKKDYDNIIYNLI